MTSKSIVGVLMPRLQSNGAMSVYLNWGNAEERLSFRSEQEEKACLTKIGATLKWDEEKGQWLMCAVRDERGKVTAIHHAGPKQKPFWDPSNDSMHRIVDEHDLTSLRSMLRRSLVHAA